MKSIATTILFLCVLNCIAQPNFRLDTSSKAIDSLFNRLRIMAKGVSNYDSTVSVPMNRYKHVITARNNDSLTITFLDENSKILYRKVNRCTPKDCRWWEVSEIYNGSAKLIYWEALNWSCLNPEEKNDPDVKYFDALLYEKGRFIYDSDGRVKEKIWYYTPLNTVRRYRYSYSENGDQIIAITKHVYDSFWE